MATSTPNLLTLPRELRDRIYSYLTHQLDLNWDYSDLSTLIGADGNVQIIEPVPVRVLDCPFPQLLCVHPRIYEEYHAACLKNLEAIIDPALHTVDKSHFHPHQISKDFSTTVLARLRHVTLFITLHAKTTFHNLDWQNQLNLLSALIKKADRLVSVRIAIRQQLHMSSPTFDESQLPSVLIPGAQRLAITSTHPFLPSLPLTLAGMSLSQRGEGYHIGYAPTSVSPSIPTSNPTHKINNRTYTLSHAIRKIGVYMYDQDERNFVKRKWRVEEVVERWPMRSYPREALESVGRKRGLELEEGGCVEWVEM
jgi:hypothetical protein